MSQVNYQNQKSDKTSRVWVMVIYCATLPAFRNVYHHESNTKQKIPNDFSSGICKL